MNPGHFAKIFDIVDSGFDWTFAAFGLIFVAVGVIGVFNPSLIPIKGQAFFDARPKLRKYFWLGILLFAVVSTVGALVSSYSTYARLRSIVAENRCRVVEGPVEQFVPRPSSGHGAESFLVQDVPFKYSDYTPNGGFNTTSVNGGPIGANSYVRICYEEDKNIILRLEIADVRPPGPPSTANTR
jgi:hypothetical protein